MPLAFLTAPLFNFTTQSGITIAILIMVVLMHILAHLFFKGNDLKQTNMFLFYGYYYDNNH